MSSRLLVFSILLLAVIASAIGVVYARQQSRLAFVELTHLGNERDDLNYEYGRLQLEQATLADNNRVEQIARSKLAMVPADAATTIVIKR